MDILLDISEIQTISSATYNYATPTYKYINKSNNYIRLSQIALGFDANFLSAGKVQIKLNNDAVTNQNSAQQEIGFVANYSVDFKENDFAIIEPNGTIEVYGRVTSGSGLIQVSVSGTKLTIEEYALVKKKYLGGVL